MRGCQDEWRLWFRSVVLPFLWASAWPCTSLTKNIRKICNLWGRSTTLWLPHLLSRLYSRYWTVSLISPLDKPFGRRLHRWTVLTGLGSLTFPPLLTRASFFFFFYDCQMKNRASDCVQSVAESGMNNIDDDEEISIERKRQRRKEEDFYSRLLWSMGQANFCSVFSLLCDSLVTLPSPTSCRYIFHELDNIPVGV